MDDEMGLPSIPDNTFDLALTDIPYNVKISSARGKAKGTRRTIDKDKVMYEDNIENYDEFCAELLRELERVAKGVIIYCGKTNLSMWCRIKEPYDILFRYARNSQSNGRASWFTRVSPMVCYGKFKNRVKTDMFEYVSWMGNHKKKLERKLIHPCPLNYDFWEDLIEQLDPQTVVDPFIGSGTTAEACTRLSIKWVGYEINKEYKVDINKRLKHCKKKAHQLSMAEYIKL
jgi:DNA modification methylase